MIKQHVTITTTANTATTFSITISTFTSSATTTTTISINTSTTTSTTTTSSLSEFPCGGPGHFNGYDVNKLRPSVERIEIIHTSKGENDYRRWSASTRLLADVVHSLDRGS